MVYATNALQEFQFTDARLVGSSTTVLTSTYKDENTLDALLVTANAAYYTAAVLATMTVNDKIFAVRSHNDAAGFMPSGTTTF